MIIKIKINDINNSIYGGINKKYLFIKDKNYYFEDINNVFNIVISNEYAIFKSKLNNQNITNLIDDIKKFNYDLNMGELYFYNKNTVVYHKDTLEQFTINDIVLTSTDGEIYFKFATNPINMYNIKNYFINKIFKENDNVQYNYIDYYIKNITNKDITLIQDPIIKVIGIDKINDISLKIFTFKYNSYYKNNKNNNNTYYFTIDEYTKIYNEIYNYLLSDIKYKYNYKDIIPPLDPIKETIIKYIDKNYSTYKKNMNYINEFIQFLKDKKQIKTYINYTEPKEIYHIKILYTNKLYELFNIFTNQLKEKALFHINNNQLYITIDNNKELINYEYHLYNVKIINEGAYIIKDIKDIKDIISLTRSKNFKIIEDKKYNFYNIDTYVYYIYNNSRHKITDINLNNNRNVKIKIDNNEAYYPIENFSVYKFEKNIVHSKQINIIETKSEKRMKHPKGFRVFKTYVPNDIIEFKFSNSDDLIKYRVIKFDRISNIINVIQVDDLMKDMGNKIIKVNLADVKDLKIIKKSVVYMNGSTGSMFNNILRIGDTVKLKDSSNKTRYEIEKILRKTELSKFKIITYYKLKGLNELYTADKLIKVI